MQVGYEKNCLKKFVTWPLFKLNFVFPKLWNFLRCTCNSICVAILGLLLTCSNTYRVKRRHPLKPESCSYWICLYSCCRYSCWLKLFWYKKISRRRSGPCRPRDASCHWIFRLVTQGHSKRHPWVAHKSLLVFHCNYVSISYPSDIVSVK